MRGQIFGPEESSLHDFTIRLIRDERVLATGTTDDLGEFRLSRTASPPFSIELERDRVRIRTPEIQA